MIFLDDEYTFNRSLPHVKEAIRIACNENEHFFQKPIIEQDNIIEDIIHDMIKNSWWGRE